MSTGPGGVGQYGGVTTSVARLALAAATAGGRGRVCPRPSFDDLYEDHFDLVWRTARRLGVPESAADDVVQDTFVVLHRRLGEYDGETPMRRWLIGILMRVVSDHRRRYRRKEAANVPHPEESERALASSAPAPSAEAEQAEAVRLLDALLAELDEDKRELLVLAQLEELTVPEIAELLGANVNTVYARLRSARREFDAAYARHRARVASTERRLP